MVRPRQEHPKVGFLFWSTYLLAVLICAGAGATVGLLLGYAVDLPRVQELEAQLPEVSTYVYSADGRIIGQFAEEKRVPVRYEEIPVRLRQAILAAEDASFFAHPGIDFSRLAVAALRDVVRGERKGASTLTMQLAKMRFTSTEKTLERKIKDVLYALNIEKTYSKEQIFTFYANQIFLGHGRYGVAAAADYYFSKPLNGLTTAECALLAGIIQAPSRHSPITQPENALSRRNWVLGRMLELGFIDRDEYETALSEPMQIKGEDDSSTLAPYFVEWVRQYLSRRYSTREIWHGGLRVYTTLDCSMQEAAERALQEGLRAFDRQKRGWAGPLENIFERGQQLETYHHSDWDLLFHEGQFLHGLTVESSADSATVRFGSFTAGIDRDAVAWTKKRRVDDVLKPGDVALFRVTAVDRKNRRLEVLLDQVPEVQGAALILDNRTGAVRAMVGGFDFRFSKFNRATQALRQPGSVFKPFTYVAALEAGFSPEDPVLDAPVEFKDALGRPYAPTNWDGEYKGLITIRQALAESRNVPTVRLANTLGPQKIAEIANRFGLKQSFPPYLSIALGSVEVTLEEIVSAFSAFPNHGVRAEPYCVERVEDLNGDVLEEHRVAITDAVISPDVADKMLYLFQEAVRQGSVRELLSLGHDIGGKTGTTNESTDVWFVGFTPSLSAGVWIGYDEKKPLGKRVFGNTLAVPVWNEMMREILADMPPERFESSWRPDDLTRLARQEETEEGAQAADGAPSQDEAVGERRAVRKPSPKQVFTVEDIPPPSSRR